MLICNEIHHFLWLHCKYRYRAYVLHVAEYICHITYMLGLFHNSDWIHQCFMINVSDHAWLPRNKNHWIRKTSSELNSTIARRRKQAINVKSYVTCRQICLDSLAKCLLLVISHFEFFYSAIIKKNGVKCNWIVIKHFNLVYGIKW